MRIRDLLDSCYEVFYTDIIIGTEDIVLWRYSYLDEIPEELLRLYMSSWSVEFVGVLLDDPIVHLVINI